MVERLACKVCRVAAVQVGPLNTCLMHVGRRQRGGVARRTGVRVMANTYRTRSATDGALLSAIGPGVTGDAAAVCPAHACRLLVANRAAVRLTAVAPCSLSASPSDSTKFPHRVSGGRGGCLCGGGGSGGCSPCRHVRRHTYIRMQERGITQTKSSSESLAANTQASSSQLVEASPRSAHPPGKCRVAAAFSYMHKPIALIVCAGIGCTHHSIVPP